MEGANHPAYLQYKSGEIPDSPVETNINRVEFAVTVRLPDEH